MSEPSGDGLPRLAGAGHTSPDTFPVEPFRVMTLSACGSPPWPSWMTNVRPSADARARYGVKVGKRAPFGNSAFTSLNVTGSTSTPLPPDLSRAEYPTRIGALAADPVTSASTLAPAGAWGSGTVISFSKVNKL